jgi:hypothetical protein
MQENYIAGTLLLAEDCVKVIHADPLGFEKQNRLFSVVISLNESSLIVNPRL